MSEQSQLKAVIAKRSVMKVSTSSWVAGDVREATTGQVVQLSRLWAVAAPEVQRPAETMPQPILGMAFYRKYTEGLLRRYVQMTMEAGRVSSMMGREVLGGRASSYRIHGFDDAVIFRLDVEKCLKQLDKAELDVLRRIAMQEYTHPETAELLGVSLRTVGSRYGRAIDRLTEILMQARLLEPMRMARHGRSRARERNDDQN